MTDHPIADIETVLHRCQEREDDPYYHESFRYKHWTIADWIGYAELLENTIRALKEK